MKPNRGKTNIKGANVVSTDDTGDFRTCILSALGKEQVCQAFSLYGLCSNPSDNSLGIALNIQGIASNTVAFIDDPKNRKKDLAKGEVAIYNYETESYVHLKEDNGIDIQVKDGPFINLAPDNSVTLDNSTGSVVTIADGLITIDSSTGSVITMTAAGVVDITAATTNITNTTAVNITAPTITITGATALNLASSTLISMTAPLITMVGAIGVTGVLTSTDFATASINSMNAHGHAPGTFIDAEARPITGKSGVPS